jgi:hypothetical protein
MTRMKTSSPKLDIHSCIKWQEYYAALIMSLPFLHKVILPVLIAVLVTRSGHIILCEDIIVGMVLLPLLLLPLLSLPSLLLLLQQH